MNIDMKDKLKNIFGDAILFDEPMSKHTTFRIGGDAACMVIPRDVEQLKQALSFCKANGVAYYIIGNGSNLLVSDRGFDGMIVKLYHTLDEITVDGDIIRVGAGALLSKIAHAAKDATLTGMEFAAGIPGTLGGAVLMNAGAYGGEMKDIVTEVSMLDENLDVITMSNADMNFGYRHSVAMEKGYIVLSATLKLEKGQLAEIEKQMETLAKARKDKQPLEYPSAGSTFKRPEGYFAGKLIDDAGLRGFQVGGAKVSDKHCGFVINANQATAADVMNLIRQVQQIVMDKFGVTLETEVRMLGEF